MSDSSDLNIRIVAPLVAYVTALHGDQALAELARAAGVKVAELSAARWVSHQAIERLLSSARALVSSESEFEKACGYMPSSVAKRFLFGAIGPRDAYELGARNMRLISTISRFTTRRESNGAVVIRYESEKAESRLMCVSRKAQIIHMPEMWSLPRAHVHEKSCIANGDRYCEYVVSVYEPNRWLPVAAGLVIGVVLALGVGALHLGTLATSLLLGLFGAGGGYVFELRRTNRLNATTSTAINQAYLAVAREEADARREMIEISRRQHEWIRRLEERSSERNDAFDQVARGIESMRENWVSSIRGFSHDLRNPLTVLKTNLTFLRETPDQLDGEGEAILNEIGAAVGQMEALLVKLMALATDGNGTIRLEPETVEVASLTTRIRNRLNALVFGRGVRASVLPTREAPATVEVDPLLLDRVLDNLLTNAAKYTQRGSIVVEIDGTPGFLTLKISDTGRGIDEAEIEKIFTPGGSRCEDRATGSWGVGLSVVVQLLGRIGGRLDVMSKPGVGTTFWAHFPVEPRSPAARSQAHDGCRPAPADDVSKVVSIRKLKTA